jgi:O-antigen ligase
LIGVLLVGSFFISLYGVKQFIFPTALDYRLIELSTASPVTYMMGGHIRAFSTLAGPFHLGIYLACTLLLLFAIWQRYPNRRRLVMLLAVPMLAALIMTVTKSNWAGLLAGILTLILLNSRQPLRLIWGLIVIGLVAGLVLYLLVWVSSITPGLETVYTGLQALLNPLEAPTFKFRMDLWNETVIPLMTQSPWFGYGTGSAGEGLINLFENTSSIYIVAHNLYFKIQIELGLLGSLCFWCFLFYALIDIWLVGRRLQDRFLKIVSNWTLAFAVAILVAGLTGAILDAYPVNLIFWLLLGISTRLKRFHVQDELDLRPSIENITLVSPKGL